MGKVGIFATSPGCTPPDDNSHTPGENIPEEFNDTYHMALMRRGQQQKL